MISPRSPLAVLFASLIVSASGDLAAVERTPTPRLSVVPVKVKPSVRQSWLSAISSDDADWIIQMLADHEPQELLPLTASNGKSALMVAAKKGSLPLARLLVESGANVNEMTETQGTPFMFAILGNNLELARWLLGQGADILSLIHISEPTRPY